MNLPSSHKANKHPKLQFIGKSHSLDIPENCSSDILDHNIEHSALTLLHEQGHSLDSRQSPNNCSISNLMTTDSNSGKMVRAKLKDAILLKRIVSHDKVINCSQTSSYQAIPNQTCQAINSVSLSSFSCSTPVFNNSVTNSQASVETRNDVLDSLLKYRKQLQCDAAGLKITMDGVPTSIPVATISPLIKSGTGNSCNTVDTNGNGLKSFHNMYGHDLPESATILPGNANDSDVINYSQRSYSHNSTSSTLATKSTLQSSSLTANLSIPPKKRRVGQYASSSSCEENSNSVSVSNTPSDIVGQAIFSSAIQRGDLVSDHSLSVSALYQCSSKNTTTVPVNISTFSQLSTASVNSAPQVLPNSNVIIIPLNVLQQQQQLQHQQQQQQLQQYQMNQQRLLQLQQQIKQQQQEAVIQNHSLSALLPSALSHTTLQSQSPGGLQFVQIPQPDGGLRTVIYIPSGRQLPIPTPPPHQQPATSQVFNLQPQLLQQIQSQLSSLATQITSTDLSKHDVSHTQNHYNTALKSPSVVPNQQMSTILQPSQVVTLSSNIQSSNIDDKKFTFITDFKDEKLSPNLIPRFTLSSAQDHSNLSCNQDLPKSIIEQLLRQTGGNGTSEYGIHEATSKQFNQQIEQNATKMAVNIQTLLGVGINNSSVQASINKPTSTDVPSITVVGSKLSENSAPMKIYVSTSLPSFTTALRGDKTEISNLLPPAQQTSVKNEGNCNADQLKITGKIVGSKIDVNNETAGTKAKKCCCDKCDMRCDNPSMLKKHVRSHEDIRPFLCTLCNIGFKTKGNLTKHTKSINHEKKQEESKNNSDISGLMASTQTIVSDFGDHIYIDQQALDRQAQLLVRGNKKTNKNVCLLPEEQHQNQLLTTENKDSNVAEEEELNSTDETDSESENGDDIADKTMVNFKSILTDTASHQKLTETVLPSLGSILQSFIPLFNKSDAHIDTDSTNTATTSVHREINEVNESLGLMQTRNEDGVKIKKDNSLKDSNDRGIKSQLKHHNHSNAKARKLNQSTASNLKNHCKSAQHLQNYAHQSYVSQQSQQSDKNNSSPLCSIDEPITKVCTGGVSVHHISATTNNNLSPVNGNHVLLQQCCSTGTLQLLGSPNINVINIPQDLPLNLSSARTKTALPQRGVNGAVLEPFVPATILNQIAVSAFGLATPTYTSLSTTFNSIISTISINNSDVILPSLSTLQFTPSLCTTPNHGYTVSGATVVTPTTASVSIMTSSVATNNNNSNNSNNIACQVCGVYKPANEMKIHLQIHAYTGDHCYAADGVVATTLNGKGVITGGLGKLGSIISNDVSNGAADINPTTISSSGLPNTPTTNENSTNFIVPTNNITVTSLSSQSARTPTPVKPNSHNFNQVNHSGDIKEMTGANFKGVSPSSSLSISNSAADPRPFKCSVCELAFRVSGHLTKHYRSKTHINGLQKSTISSVCSEQQPNVNSSTVSSNVNDSDNTVEQRDAIEPCVELVNSAESL